MMWNWQLSALACGTAILLYDGSVSYPGPDALPRLLAREGVTVFGTSPTYLQLLRDAGLRPRDLAAWPRLRAIQSTGSILWDHLYDWVHEAWAEVPVQSISGGTDIVGCFVLGHPLRPLWRGESQALSLGHDLRAFTADGPVTVGTGDLVCARPFPSRPVHFLGDPDGARFHAAYFAEHEGYWNHGDRIELTERGTARILGRNDGTMNVRGVRIGPAELYRIVLGIDGIADAMALEQRAPREPGGTRLVLLVVLQPGLCLDRPLVLRIKKTIAERASRAHVPAVVAAVAELPTTHSGKKSERAATEALHGRPVPNAAALRNPGALDAIREHPELRVPG
jgi:acetoacetyl-CoA synthetase